MHASDFETLQHNAFAARNNLLYTVLEDLRNLVCSLWNLLATALAFPANRGQMQHARLGSQVRQKAYLARR